MRVVYVAMHGTSAHSIACVEQGAATSIRQIFAIIDHHK